MIGGDPWQPGFWQRSDEEWDSRDRLKRDGEQCGLG